MFLGINGKSPGPQIEVKILKLISTLQLYHTIIYNYIITNLIFRYVSETQ